MKCSGASKILHGLVHDTTRISSFFSDFRVASWTNSCRISELPLQFISFLTVCNLTWITPPCLKGEGGGCDKRPVYRFCIESSFVPSWRYTSVSQSVFHYSIAEYRHNRILKIQTGKQEENNNRLTQRWAPLIWASIAILKRSNDKKM